MQENFQTMVFCLALLHKNRRYQFCVKLTPISWAPLNLDCFCLVKYTSAGHNHVQSIRLVNYTSSISSKYASIQKITLKNPQNKTK